MLAAAADPPGADAREAARPHDARSPASARRSAAPLRAGLAQHRGRPSTLPPEDWRGSPLGAAAPGRRFLRRSAAPSRRAATASRAGRLLRRAGGGQLSALLPAEIPFPERRLSERRLGRALRLPGRGAVRRRRGGDAAPGAGAAAPGFGAAGSRAARGCSIIGCGTGAFLREVKRNHPAPRGDRARPVGALSRCGAAPARRLVAASTDRGGGRGDAVRRRRVRRRHLHLSVPRVAAARRRRRSPPRSPAC